MRKLPLVILYLLLASCLSEKNVDLAKPSTFIRYFSDGYNNDAIAVEEVEDANGPGYTILANSTILNSESDDPRNRIVLIRTNAYGDELWRKSYPENLALTAPRWVANSLTLLPGGGYLIAGEEIQNDNFVYSKALIMKVDANGEGLQSITYSAELGLAAGVSVTAKAATLSNSGSFIMLATSPVDNSNTAIHLAEITSNLGQTPTWYRTYIQGRADIKNKIFFIDGPIPFVYWSGNSQQLLSSVDGFVTKSRLNNLGTENGQTDIIGTTATNDFAGDFCQKGILFGYAGYTDKNDAGDITFYEVNQEGEPTREKIYTEEIFNVSGATNNKKEYASAITATADNGYIILATIDTYTDLLGAGNTDLLLLKIRSDGSKQWSQPYGSFDADIGSSIRQASDGGYLVLGTSRVAAQRTILLIKTDGKGQIR